MPEVDALQLAGLNSPPLADQGLTPSTLLTPGEGSIDYSKSSWSKSSWSIATGSLSADFTKSSGSCTCYDSTGSVTPSKSSWSSTTWGIDGFG